MSNFLNTKREDPEILDKHGVTQEDVDLFRALAMLDGDSNGQKLGKTPLGIHICRLMKKCTKSFTRSRFMDQYYVECFDCQVKICGTCKRNCHENHNVSEIKFGCMYCHCGAHCACKDKSNDSDFGKVESFLEEKSTSEIFNWMGPAQDEWEKSIK